MQRHRRPGANLSQTFSFLNKYQAFGSKDHQKPFNLLNLRTFWSGKFRSTPTWPPEMILEGDPTAAARQDVSQTQSTGTKAGFHTISQTCPSGSWEYPA
jgi:hypothetical protein